MTPDAAIVLTITGAALVLFVTELAAPDIVALMVLVSLGVTGILDLPVLFSGFGSPVELTLIGIFMLTAALRQTGVTAYIGQFILRRTQNLDERPLVGMLVLSAAFAAMWMNTVASAALIAPVGRRIALKRDISPSLLMMPISFGALLGGMGTLLTTSNLLVAGLLTERGLPTFGLFDFLPVGGPIALVGLIYLTLFSKSLLPERAPSDQWSGLRNARQELTKTYRLSMRLHEAYVLPDSPLVGSSLSASDLGHQYGVTVSAVVRGRDTFAPPDPAIRLRAGDWLLLQGRPTEVETAAGNLGLDLFGFEESSQAVLFRANSELAEVALSPRSKLFGSTLSDISFRDKYGVTVLAIWHEGRPVRSYLSEYALNRGDAMLVMGTPERLGVLSRDSDFLVLTHLPEIPEHRERAAISLLLLVAFLVVVAFNWLPVALAALLAAIASVLTGCETVEQARDSISWQVLFLVGGMLPLATALDQTGAAVLVIDGLFRLTGEIGPRGVLMLFFLLTALVSQFTSGQAATLIVAPLALSSAFQFAVNPQTLMVAVAIGASTGFLSPISHPANLLVMGSGGYRFGDYARLGAPLVLVAALGVYLLAPLVYPF